MHNHFLRSQATPQHLRPIPDYERSWLCVHQSPVWMDETSYSALEVAGEHWFLFTCLSASLLWVTTLGVLYKGSGSWTRFLTSTQPSTSPLGLWNPVLCFPAPRNYQHLKVNRRARWELDRVLECVCCTCNYADIFVSSVRTRQFLLQKRTAPRTPAGCKGKAYVSPTVPISYQFWDVEVILGSLPTADNLLAPAAGKLQERSPVTATVGMTADLDCLRNA